MRALHSKDMVKTPPDEEIELLMSCNKSGDVFIHCGEAVETAKRAKRAKKAAKERTRRADIKAGKKVVRSKAAGKVVMCGIAGTNLTKVKKAVSEAAVPVVRVKIEEEEDDAIGAFLIDKLNKPLP